MKTDIISLVDVFEKFMKGSTKEYGISPLYCFCICSYTYQCGLTNHGINLQTLQAKDMILLLENNIRGGLSSVMGDRYVKTHDYKKTIFIDAIS